MRLREYPQAARSSRAATGPSLSVDALADGARRRTAVPYGSYNVQPAAGGVLTPSLSHGTVAVLDPAGRVLPQVRVAQAAHDACVVP